MFEGVGAVSRDRIYSLKDRSEWHILNNAIKKLQSDDLLSEVNAGGNYTLGGEALIFIQKGKYLGLMRREKAKEEKQIRTDEIKELLDDATLKANKSVIETNQSVKDTNTIQQRNIRLNEKLFWVTLGVALAGAIASWIQVVNGNESRNLKDKVQMQDTLIQSLQKQLLQIRSAALPQKAAKNFSTVTDTTKTK